MQKITICRGLPGSGKSQWSKQYVLDHPDTVKVCRDDLRHMRGKYWLPEQEKLITEWEISCIDKALKKDFNVLVDSTNLRPKYLRKFFAKYYPKYLIVLQDFFDVSVEECIRRDKNRENPVGEAVIREKAQKYLSKSLDVSSKEFIDSLYSQPIKDEKIVQDPNLPHAIICDLDGTLAIHNGRGPFEYHRCDEDLLKECVGNIVRPHVYGKGTYVVYLSGREDSCKSKTIEWLKKHILWLEPSCEIHMRKTGDMRKDAIIKKELFDEHIKDKYYIEFILDDRNQVVDMWRSLGLTCLQVDYGDF